MGNEIARHKPPDVPWEVLIAEIAELKSDGKSEVEICPRKFDDDDDDDENAESEEIRQYLDSKARRCKKKHIHDQYLPVKDLKLQDLPLYGRCERFFNLVQSHVSRTVRLVVRYTSTARPNKPYWCGILRGSDCRRLGTGFVYNIDGDRIMICTAGHVVFDIHEVKETTVEFFYDDEDRSQVVKAFGVEMFTHRTSQYDQCTFICKTKTLEDLTKIKVKINSKMRCENPDKDFNLGFIVAHPHGTAKKISFSDKIIKVNFGLKCPNVLLARFYYLISNLKSQHISEKQLMYLVFHHLFREGIIKDMSTEKQADDVLKRMEEKCGLRKPSPSQQIQFDIAKSKADKEWMTAFAQNVFIRFRSWLRLTDEDMYNKMYAAFEEFNTNVAGLLPDTWKTKLNSLETETQNAMFQISTGSDVSFSHQLYHDVPTCVGSSGSVFKYLNYLSDRSVLQVHLATHVAAGENKNKCSLGYMWEL